MKKIIIILIVMGSMLSLFATELIINKADGTSSSFELNEIESITFSDTTAQMPTEGLIAYYPFNGNAIDESDNGNNGIIYGATLINDRFGNPNSAYTFDGLDDYIEVNDAETLNPYSGITYGGWFNVANLTQYNKRMIAKTEYSGYNLTLNHENYENLISARIRVNNSYLVTYFSTDLIQANSWFSVYVTFDGYNERLYLNGQQVDLKTRDGVIIASNQPLLIGAEPSYELGVMYYLTGIIDDVRIYNRALTQTEIQTLYNEAK